MRRSLPFLLVLLSLLTVRLPHARAIAVTANDTASMIAAINAINAAGPGTHSITIQNDIALTADLPDMALLGVLTINGGGFTLSGNTPNRLLDIDGPGGSSATVRNLTLTNPGGPCTNTDIFDTLRFENARIQGCGASGITGNNATLELVNTVVTNNTGVSGGGIFWETGLVTMDANSRVTNNTATGLGGGIYLNDFTLTINGGQINGNTANQGGGILMVAGTLTMNGGQLNNNRAVAGEGGGLFAFDSTGSTINNATIRGNESTVDGGFLDIPAGDLTITNSLISENRTVGAGAAGSVGGIAALTITGSRVLNNTASSGFGGIVSQAAATMNATNTCFVGNGTAINTLSGILQDATGNWWGSVLGPNNAGDDVTGQVDTSGFLTAPPPGCGVAAPGLTEPDFFALPINETLGAASADQGLLFNDFGDLLVTPVVNQPTQFGSVSINADGSFTYTPQPGQIGIDQFTYTATDGVNTFQVPVSVTVGEQVVIQFPRSLIVDSGGTIQVPGVRLIGDPAAQVGMTLSVSNGTLKMPDNPAVNGNETRTITLAGTVQTLNTLLRDLTYTADEGFVGEDQLVIRSETGFGFSEQLVPIGVRIIAPPEKDGQPDTPLPIDDVQLANSPQAPNPNPPVTISFSVSNGTLDLDDGTASVLRPRMGTNTPNRVEDFAQATTVTGRGTMNLTVSGPLNEVNARIDDLVYTPNLGFRGVDQLVIVLTAPTNVDRRVVDLRIGIGGGGSGSSSVVAPSEPVLLRNLSVPGSFILAEIPPNVVPGGDVFARVLATNGEILIGNPAEIGELAVFRTQILHSAELFGLTFGGVSVPAFTGGVKVCLLGEGIFYFRDATGVPRTTVQLPTFAENGYTCSIIPNSGTVILVVGESDIPAEVTGGGDGVRIELADCMVTTNNILNLRAGPSMNAEILRPIPFNVTLTAIAEQDTWYEVDYLGLFGWVSEDFVTGSAGCG